MIQVPPEGRSTPAGSRKHLTRRPRERSDLAALDHRVRNNYAALLALVDVTRSSVKDVSAFATAMSGYIRAVSSSHELLSKSDFRFLSLAELIDALAGPTKNNCMEVHGPEVRIASRQAVALAFVSQVLLGNCAQPNKHRDTRWDWHWSDRSSLRLQIQVSNCPDLSQNAMNLVLGLVRTELRGHAQFNPDSMTVDVETSLDPVE